MKSLAFLLSLAIVLQCTRNVKSCGLFFPCATTTKAPTTTAASTGTAGPGSTTTLSVSTTTSNPNFPGYCSASGSSSTLPQCSDIDDFQNARNRTGNSPRPSSLLPPWMNLTLANAGRKICQKYLFNCFISHFFGLFMIVSFPDGRDVLMYTNTSGNPTGASKRYQATIAQVLTWYQNDLSDPDVIISLTNVRNVHIAAQQAATFVVNNNQSLNNFSTMDTTCTTCLKGEFFKDLHASNIPQAQRAIPPSHWTNLSAVPSNQQILALTQYAFVGLPYLFPASCALSATEEELWAFNHFWAVLGWALGLDDEYNLALQPDPDTQREAYLQIWEQYYTPSVFNLDIYTTKFLEQMLLGLQQVASVCSPNLMMELMLTKLFLIPAPATLTTLSFEERLMKEFLEITYVNLKNGNPFVRVTMNAAINAQAFYSGIRLFGQNYTTQHWRSSACFYAKYGNNSLVSSIPSN